MFIDDPEETVWRRRANIAKQRQKAISARKEQGKINRERIHAKFIEYGGDAAAIKRIAYERGRTECSVRELIRRHAAEATQKD